MDASGAPEKQPLLPGVMYDVTIQDPKARIQANLDAYKSDDIPVTFDLPLMRTYLKVVDASKLPNNTAVASFSMIAPSEFCNRTGMLHGGAVAMIVDMATTLAQAPLAAPGYWEFGGVSRTLTVTYLRPIPKDTEILIVCEVLQVGRALVTIQAKMYRRLDMVLLCCGEHNKAAVDVAVRSRKL